MSSQKVQNPLTLRLTPSVNEALAAMSKTRGVSMNMIVEEQILAAAESNRKERPRPAFARI